MATIVLVHGVDNERESADLIEAAWLPALAGSVRLANEREPSDLIEAAWLPALAESVRHAARHDLADRLWPPRARADSIESRASYYGQLFRSADQQGAGDDLGDLTPEQISLAGELALEWLERIAVRAAVDSADAVQAQRTLDIVREPEKAQAQGRGNVLREALKTLSRVSWLAHIGMNVTTRFLVPSLAQVTRYLTDDSVRTRARKAVLDHVCPETRVIIGHSLGSVVAYECAHRLTHPLALLVTLGSPLGLRTIVTERLSPRPSFPPMAARWLNVANREDVVAAEPDLRALFAHDVPASSRFEGIRFDEACEDPHRAETYLGRVPVGRAVIEALV